MPCLLPAARFTAAQVSGLWILLAGAVVAALLVYLGGQVMLCCARRVSRTKMYKGSVRSLQRTSKRLSFSRRSGGAGSAASFNGNGSEGEPDSRAEAGLGLAPADPQALSAAVAELAAQLQQALAAQGATAAERPLP